MHPMQTRFKNICIYRLAPDWSATPAALQSGLETNRFIECGTTQEKSFGWVEPRGQAHGSLVETVDGQILFNFMVESKSVPRSVLDRKVTQRVAKIETEEGRKIGKKEKKELEKDIRQELLSYAFTKQSNHLVWIDPKARFLVLDCASPAAADDVLTSLVNSFEGFSAKPISTNISPAWAMAQWLYNIPPHDFTVDDECELKDESKAVVRYANHSLHIANLEISQHILQGKEPTRLALTWNAQVSFVLTDGLQLKKLVFIDTEDAPRATNKDEDFDTDIAIQTGALRQLLPALITALGGEEE